MHTISLLLSNPASFAAYIFLLIALISCFVDTKYYLFVPLYITSYLFAFYGGVVRIQSIIPLALLVLCLLSLKLKLKRFFHLFSGMVIAIIGIAIMAHLMGGFYNLLLFKEVSFGEADIALNIYLNYDKVSLGIFLLGLSIPILKGKEQWKNAMLVTFLWTAFSLFIMLGFARFSGLVVFDPKFPAITLYWLIINFFFVVIPEEAFYRGFLQNEIIKSLPNKAAPFLGILTVSLLFGLMHILFVPSLLFVVSAFLGSILYGTVFYLTRSIESAIITHFSVNIIHFFFFSYPFYQA